MPELNDQQVLEQTRAEISDANDESRAKFHHEDVVQVKRLADAFYNHCKQNETSDKETRHTLKLLLEKIESLMWLNDEEVKPVILETVEEARGRTWLSKKIEIILKTTGIVVAILAGVSAIIWSLIKNGR